MSLKNNALLVLFVLAISAEFTIAQIQPPLPISTKSNVEGIKEYSGIISEQYANGSPHMWKTLKNGKAEGLWLEWHPNGTLRYRAYWKNNKGHGKWEYFFPNGKLRTESFYIEDKAYGIFRSYFENGQLETDATYINDKKVGIELTYKIDGTIQSRKRYEDGVQVIDEPILFEPGKISSIQNNEWGINFAPDGNTAYFTRRDATTNKKRIYMTHKTEQGWSEPLIASFSTGEDESPFINQQGNKLFFSSFRPLPDDSTIQTIDMNIWFMEMTGDGWSAPKPIKGPINQVMKKANVWPANYEAGPITDESGNLYYWTKSSKSNVTNLFFASLKADGTFGTQIELAEPSDDKYFDSAPCLSNDGNLLLFASDNRPDSWGTDLFYSKKINGKWSKPKNMGIAINSYGDDSCPSFSPDGKYFFFSSNRAGNKDTEGEPIWDIYYIETRFLIIE